MTRSSVVFLFNLVQDVSIIRPLAYLLRRESDHEIVFLISHRFLDRDRQRIWQREIAQMRVDLCASMYLYGSPLDAHTIIQGLSGYIVAASESNLGGHVETHDVFRIAPPNLLRVVLQHGFECVGFLQNREHNIAHGRNVTFAADVICSWMPASETTATPVSERDKICVTGPSTVLQHPGRGDKPLGGGGDSSARTSIPFVCGRRAITPLLSWTSSSSSVTLSTTSAKTSRCGRILAASTS